LASGCEDISEHPRRRGFPIRASHANDEKILGRVPKTRCRHCRHGFPDIRNHKLRNLGINPVIYEQRNCSGCDSITRMEMSVISDSGDAAKK
jgi:nucleoside-triphosphatase THEP1